MQDFSAAAERFKNLVCLEVLEELLLVQHREWAKQMNLMR
jgi:hypothetical protein